jgi:hypothetical protein
MNVICGSIFAKIRPELDVGRFPENRFENYRIIAVGRFRETETDIDAEDFHFFPPYVLLFITNPFYLLTSEKSKKTIKLGMLDAKTGARRMAHGTRRRIVVSGADKWKV